MEIGNYGKRNYPMGRWEVTSSKPDIIRSNIAQIPSGQLHGGGFSAKFRVGGATHSFKM